MNLNPVRLMYGVVNVEDLKLAQEARCNVVFCTNFDSRSEDYQRAYMAEAKRLSLQVTWNLWGGDWTWRDETILRWKDDPVVFAWYYITEPYVPGGGCYLNAEQQRERYNRWKNLVGPENKIPFMQDRGLFNPRYDFWAEDALDILMIYSYAYEFADKLDWMYDRMFANLVNLKTRTYPIIPLIQCFWTGNYQQPPLGAVKDQYDRWERFLQSKGWAGQHCGFYRLEGYQERDIKHNPYLFNEIKVLNTDVSPPEVITDKTMLHSCTAKLAYKVSSYPVNNDPLSCPYCGLVLGVEGIKGSVEIIEQPEVITPHIVICEGCGSKLELSISSITNKNIQQYCPVCSAPAD